MKIHMERTSHLSDKLNPDSSKKTIPVKLSDFKKFF